MFLCKSCVLPFSHFICLFLLLSPSLFILLQSELYDVYMGVSGHVKHLLASFKLRYKEFLSLHK